MRTWVTKLWGPILCTLGVIAGFGAGLMSADPASATATYTMKVMGGADPHLNCGWHTSCKSPYSSGVALDWRSYGGHQAYFRTFMYKSSGAQSTVARATVEIPTGQSCKTVWLHIGSPAGSTYRGTMKYLHVDERAPGGATIDIVGSTSGYWTQSHFADTAASETCQAWTAEHLHQSAYWENATGSRNTVTYPGYVNPGDYYIDIATYYTDQGVWSY